MSAESGPVGVATDLPCPAWCSLPPGHPLDIEDPCEPVLTRTHWLRLGDDLAWELTQIEQAAGPAGPIERNEPASGICLTIRSVNGRSYDSDPLPVTPAQLRAHAASLLHAADTLDHITRSTQDGAQ